MLYGAMAKPPNNLLEGLLYTRQVEPTISWISAFLNGARGDVVRVMHVDAHFRRGTKVDIIVDACPWGMGGILTLDGVPQQYFAVATTEEDARMLGLELSRDSKCQQAFEALAMLVALRHWHYHWAHRRCVIHVAGDNMAALSMITKMQPHSYSLGVVARELALDISQAVYEPQLASHVPGVANVAADALSRKYEPSTVPYKLPPVLAECTEVFPKDRAATWWRSLAPRRSRSQQDRGDQKYSSIAVAASGLANKRHRRRQD